MSQLVALQHATLIDGTGADPVPDATILITDGRISAAGPAASVTVPPEAERRDCSGAYIIPGLMDANIHLVSARTPDTLLEFEGRYDQLAVEAAEIALKDKGARVLLTTDAFAYGQRVKNHAGFRPGILDDSVPDMPTQIGRAHFLWIQAACERGIDPMEILRSVTAYTAQAYGKDDLYDTLTPGKAADLVMLDADPLTAPENYGAIRAVVKDRNTIDGRLDVFLENFDDMDNRITQPLEHHSDPARSWSPPDLFTSPGVKTIGVGLPMRQPVWWLA